MVSKVQKSLSVNNHVRVTLILAYIDKATSEHHYNHTHLDDCYPDLINTHNLMNILKSNDFYHVVGIEYDWITVPFDQIDMTVVNTIH